MSDGTPAITKEERAKLSKWARVTKCDFIEVKPSTISAYEAALSASEARVKELEEALERIAAYPDQEVEERSITVAMMASRARAALKGNEG